MQRFCVSKLAYGVSACAPWPLAVGLRLRHARVRPPRGWRASGRAGAWAERRGARRPTTGKRPTARATLGVYRWPRGRATLARHAGALLGRCAAGPAYKVHCASKRKPGFRGDLFPERAVQPPPLLNRGSRKPGRRLAAFSARTATAKGLGETTRVEGAARRPRGGRAATLGLGIAPCSLSLRPFCGVVAFRAWCFALALKCPLYVGRTC